MFIEVEGINYYKVKNIEAYEASADSTSKTITFFVILMLIVNAGVAVALFRIFQLIDYILFYNVNHPPNLKEFLDTLSRTIFEEFENLLGFMEDNECNVEAMGRKFRENEF